MTKDELKNCGIPTVTVRRGAKSITGNLNYVLREDRFQIVYYKPEGGRGANDVIEVTDEMIEKIIATEGKLVLEETEI